MKKSFLLIGIASIILSSCNTQKRCDSKYPPKVIVEVRDSIYEKDSIIYKVVEVPVYIKGDTITRKDTVYKDSKTGLVNSNALYAETEFAKATAKVTNSILNLTLIQKDSVFSVKSDSLIKEAYYWKEKYYSSKSTEIVELKTIPKIYKIFSLLGLATLMWIFIKLLIKYKSKIKL